MNKRLDEHYRGLKGTERGNISCSCQTSNRTIPRSSSS